MIHSSDPDYAVNKTTADGRYDRAGQAGTLGGSGTVDNRCAEHQETERNTSEHRSRILHEATLPQGSITTSAGSSRTTASFSPQRTTIPAGGTVSPAAMR